MRSIPGWGVVSSAAAPVLLIGGWTLAARIQRGGFDSVTGTISALAADDANHRWVMTSALVGVGAAHVGTALALRPATPAARLLLATGGVATVLVAANPLPSEGAHAPRHALAAGVAFVALGAWPAVSWRRRPSGPERTPAAYESSHLRNRAANTGPAANRRSLSFVRSIQDPADPGGPANTHGPANAGTSVTNRSVTDGSVTDGSASPPVRLAAAEVPVPFRPMVAVAAAGVLLGGLGWFFAELVAHSQRVGVSERVAAGTQALWPLAAVLLTRRSAARSRRV